MRTWVWRLFMSSSLGLFLPGSGVLGHRKRLMLRLAARRSAAAYAEEGKAKDHQCRAELGHRAGLKKRRDAPLRRKHQSADSNAEDRTQPPDSERPADSGGADVSRVEARRVSVAADLATDHGDAGNEDGRHEDRQHGSGKADGDDRDEAGHIGEKQDAMEAEPLDQQSEPDGT